jgi:hypothetical protein
MHHGQCAPQCVTSYRLQKALNNVKVTTMLVSQAEFARMKSVTAAAVSQWKRQGRLTMVGKMVDLERTEENLLTHSRHHSKRIKPALDVNLKPHAVNIKIGREVNRAGLWDDDVLLAPVDGLPWQAHHYADGIDTGANDLSVLLLKSGMEPDATKALVRAWIARQRHGWVGVLDDVLAPPAGCATWADCALFRAPWPEDASAGWAELVAEAGSAS